MLAQAMDSMQQIDPAMITTIGGALLSCIAGAFGIMWRQAVTESKRKDTLIDKLTDQIIRTADGNTRIADAQMQLVVLHEQEQERGRR